jgi:hypothetical protein
MNENEHVHLILAKIKFDMNNELEDLAQSNGQYWIHCKHEEIKYS